MGVLEKTTQSKEMEAMPIYNRIKVSNLSRTFKLPRYVYKYSIEQFINECVLVKEELLKQIIRIHPTFFKKNEYIFIIDSIMKNDKFNILLDIPQKNLIDYLKRVDIDVIIKHIFNKTKSSALIKALHSKYKSLSRIDPYYSLYNHSSCNDYISDESLILTLSMYHSHFIKYRIYDDNRRRLINDAMSKRCYDDIFNSIVYINYRLKDTKNPIIINYMLTLNDEVSWTLKNSIRKMNILPKVLVDIIEGYSMWF